MKSIFNKVRLFFRLMGVVYVLLHIGLYVVDVIWPEETHIYIE